MKLIDIDKIKAEVEKKTHGEQGYSSGDAECGYRDCARDILSFLNTIELKEVDLEKIKDYDEAIRKAKITLDCCGSASIATKNTVYNIFPELRESEDERIRGAIIHFISHTPTVPKGIIDKEIMIAWLEKQTENDSNKMPIWKHWKDGIAGNGEGKPIYLVKIGNTYSLNSCLGFECDYIELSELDNLMLEKQRHTDGIIEKAKTEKQRVIITETDGNANIDWDTRSLEDAKRLLECGLQYINTEIEKQSKPKFKIGDWIINHQTGLIKHIKNVLLCGINGIYEFESSSMPIDYVDNAFHLWAIQDAKDGDVLFAENFDNIGGCVFLFKGLDSWRFDAEGDRAIATGYCCTSITESGSTDFGIQGPDCVEIKRVHPATKEQRDLLFQKMKESGYEWDAEKKELKKIVVHIFHIGDRVRYKGHACDGVITEITDADYICGDTKLPISTQDKLELVEQKPAEWKQENVEELSDFENAMMHIGGSFFGENAGLDPNDTAAIKEQAELLLKLAPKTEWSEEDEKIRKSLLRWIQSNSYTSIAGIQINDVIAWLKPLRPQINVTDEELAQAKKEAYNEVLDKIEYHDDWPTFDDGWNAAIWYLKKRNDRPQSHWKPSDAQIQALKEACDKSWEPDGLDPLYTLYKDLKKLKGE